MEMKQKTGIALIGDVVGSRTHTDRAAMQAALVSAIERVNDRVESVQPLSPTIGDEFQAVYADIGTAVNTTLVIRLSLPDELDCRYGLGAGTYATVGESSYGVMQDGPAWWAARDAIVIAKDREKRKNGTLRTWFGVTESTGERDDVGTINALLLCRDHIVTSMNPRQRRLLLGLIDGTTQSELAKTEGISPSAVSQALHASGAYAVLGAYDSIGAAS